MAYRVQGQTDRRLTRLEAARSQTPDDPPKPGDPEWDKQAADYLWKMIASGIFVPNTDGMWCIPADKGFPRYDVPNGAKIVDWLNNVAPFRELAEAVKDQRTYTVTGERGVEYTYEVWPVEELVKPDRPGRIIG